MAATVNWNATPVLQRLALAANVGVFRGTEAVRNTAIAKVNNPPKTGREYRRRGVTHQASAPGEAPATDTGRLVGAARTEYDRANLSGRVIFATAYAAALEFGTQRMAARPFLRNSLAENRAAIREAIREEMAAALR
jgi:HK97 gp10 family phage protein